MDALTPLLTPLTYEGLLDELFHIKQGVGGVRKVRGVCGIELLWCGHEWLDGFEGLGGCGVA